MLNNSISETNKLQAKNPGEKERIESGIKILYD